MAKKTIVVSGINMVEGGIFTILHNCLQKLATYNQDKDLKIYALVHNASQFNFEFSDTIEFIEFPKSKQFWGNRLYYEYNYFKKLSLELKPDVWFSLHDISPNVVCENQFVYCHNPNVFYKPSWKDWKLEYKVGLFHIFYQLLFRINIKKNKAVFVQQHWIKDEFKKRFGINNVYVATPEHVAEKESVDVNLDPNFIHFFYPSFPRTFKNFELIAEAVKLLPDSVKNKIKVHLTIAESDNKYSKYIVDKYPFSPLNYIGRISRAEVFGYYKKMDCLLFPSKIETWGLPISEAKAFDKPILLANLPYAKESIGNYDKVSFFNPTDAAALAQLMAEFVSNAIQYQGNKYTFDSDDQFNDWNSLFDFILKD